MKILVTCPYSYNFRNIVCSGFLRDLLNRNHKVRILVSDAHLNSLELKELKILFPTQLEVDVFEIRYSWIKKLILIVLRSWCYKNQHTKTFESKSNYLYSYSKKEWIKYFGLSIFFPRNFSLYRCALKLLRPYLFHSKSIATLYSEFKPGIIINTLPNKYDESCYAWEAKKLKIKILAINHSWDVITTKGFYAVTPDHIVFWSQTNLAEYQRYVAELMLEAPKADVVGPIQFDIYKNFSDPVAHKQKIGLTLNKKIILYTTSVPRLVPDEVNYIKKLIDYLAKRDDLFLYIRPHPQAPANHFAFDECERKVFKVGRAEPLSSSSLDGVAFRDDALVSLRNDLMVCDIVINFASSMALDAMAMNKPAIWLSDFSSEVREFYTYEHISKARSTLEIPIASSFSQLLEIIDEKLKCSKDYKSAFEREYAVIGNAKANIMKKIEAYQHKH